MYIRQQRLCKNKNIGSKKVWEKNVVAIEAFALSCSASQSEGKRSFT